MDDGTIASPSRLADCLLGFPFMNDVLKPSQDPKAARWASLLALPVSDQPLTDEEREAFDEGQRFLASGGRGHTTEEMLARVEQMQRDAGE